MTEDEAKTKWCPAAKGNQQYDTNTRIVGEDHCIGSACMWWRWEAEAGDDPKSTEGYCGPAGKP